MAGSKNTTCPATPMPLSVTGSDHHIMALVSLVGLALTVAISLILVFMHLLRYSAPKEQRQIIRIAFTPVVMAIVAFVTFLSYDVAQYIQPIIDLYDAFALASLFLLYVQFSVPSGTFGQELFESMAKSASMDGQHAWAKTKWILAFQFAMVEPILFIITDVALATNDFCAGSLKPRYANIWVSVIRTFSTVLAVLAVWKMYTSTKAIMKPRRAMSKLLSFKVIIGLNVLQTWIFKILVQHDILKPSSRLSYADLLYGVPAALTSMESVLFALSFHYAYSSSEYANKPKRMSFLRAVANSANPTDLLKGMVRTITLLVSSRSKEDYVAADSSIKPLRAFPNNRTSSPAPEYAVPEFPLRPMDYQVPRPSREASVRQRDNPEHLNVYELVQRDSLSPQGRDSPRRGRSPSPGLLKEGTEGRDMV